MAEKFPEFPPHALELGAVVTERCLRQLSQVEVLDAEERRSVARTCDVIRKYYREHFRHAARETIKRDKEDLLMQEREPVFLAFISSIESSLEFRAVSYEEISQHVEELRRQYPQWVASEAESRARISQYHAYADYMNATDDTWKLEWLFTAERLSIAVERREIHPRAQGPNLWQRMVSLLRRRS